MSDFVSAVKLGRGKLQGQTSYTATFVSPPADLYTGISPNIGLKARVEGATSTIDPSKLGLGEHGKSVYQRTHVHMGDAYRDRIKQDPAGKKNRFKMDQEHAGYTTTYSVWGA